MSCYNRSGTAYLQDMAPKTRNLKASCDFCALSKVKCDRGRPQCLRCLKNEVECHYSETRRMGKVRQLYTTSAVTRPSSSNTTLNGQWNRQFESETCTNRPQEASESQTLVGDASGSSEYAMFMDLFDQSKTNVGTEIFPNHNQSNHNDGASTSLPYSSPESQNDFSHILSSQLDADEEKMEYMNEMSFQYPSFDLDSAPGKHTKDSFQGQQPSLDEANCMKRAFATLENLHLPVSRCSRHEHNSQSPATNSRGLDSILTTNRMAIATMLDILSCPCAGSCSIFSLLVLIAHQVMDSYLSLSKQQLCISRSPTDELSFGDDIDGSGQEAVSSVVDVPMAIGGYILDGEAKKKVLVQVLRSEMEKMDHLINALLSRYTANEPTQSWSKTAIESLDACQKKVLASLMCDNGWSG